MVFGPTIILYLSAGILKPSPEVQVTQGHLRLKVQINRKLIKSRVNLSETV